MVVMHVIHGPVTRMLEAWVHKEIEQPTKALAVLSVRQQPK